MPDLRGPFRMLSLRDSQLPAAQATHSAYFGPVGEFRRRQDRPGAAAAGLAALELPQLALHNLRAAQ